MTRLLRRIAATFVEPASAAGSPPAVASPPTAPGQDEPAAPAVVFMPPRLARVSRAPDVPPHAASAPVVSAQPDAARAQGAPAQPDAARAQGAPAQPDAARAQGAPAQPDAARAPSAPAQPDAARAPSAPAQPDAVVLAADAAAVALGAACAGELRARAHSGAALLCVWQPTRGEGDDVELPWDGDEEDGLPPSTPAGATTPAARRLAGRLAAHGLETTARGRLAWLALAPDPAHAATQVRRCVALADAPLVLAVAGPRDAAFEPLIAEARRVLAVLPPDADPALQELVTAALPGRGGAIVAPLRSGPPRWAAMAGLGRLRSLATEDA